MFALAAFQPLNVERWQTYLSLHFYIANVLKQNVFLRSIVIQGRCR